MLSTHIDVVVSLNFFMLEPSRNQDGSAQSLNFAENSTTLQFHYSCLFRVYTLQVKGATRQGTQRAYLASSILTERRRTGDTSTICLPIIERSFKGAKLLQCHLLYKADDQDTEPGLHLLSQPSASQVRSRTTLCFRSSPSVDRTCFCSGSYSRSRTFAGGRLVRVLPFQ
jgi:hypothetical protein